jgi:hypothetical protein
MALGFGGLGPRPTSCHVRERGVTSAAGPARRPEHVSGVRRV